MATSRLFNLACLVLIDGTANATEAIAKKRMMTICELQVKLLINSSSFVRMIPVYYSVQHLMFIANRQLLTSSIIDLPLAVRFREQELTVTG